MDSRQDCVQNLKNKIHVHLKETGIYSEIQQILTHELSTKGQEFSIENALSLLEKNGLLKNVLNSFTVKSSLDKSAYRNDEKSVSTTHGLRLHIQILGGVGFIVPKTNGSLLYVEISFSGQRAKTSLVPYSSEPIFDEDVILPILQQDETGNCLECDSPIRITLVKVDENNKRSILGENNIEWRRLLSLGNTSLSLEMGSITGLGATVGVLHLDLQLVGASKKFCAEDVEEYLSQERIKVNSKEREFALYAKRWWNEYQSLLKKDRKLKLFISTGTPTGVKIVPIFTQVNPICCQREFRSPLEAARFVSLFFEGKGKPERNELDLDTNISRNQLQILSSKEGNSFELAFLLCSIFLGMGLRAFCMLGSSHQNTLDVWVCTKGNNHTFIWDPTTGLYKTKHEIQQMIPGSSVWCVFNSDSFYANLQEDESLHTCSLDFDDEHLWKGMNPVKIKMYPTSKIFTKLLASNIESRNSELCLERDLRRCIGNHRRTRSLEFEWNEIFDEIFAQSLYTFEKKRTLGESVICNDLQDLVETAIRDRIPNGRTFKAFPLHYSHISAPEIFQKFYNNPVGKDIVENMNASATFGICCYIKVYPEDMVSVWTMISVYY